MIIITRAFDSTKGQIVQIQTEMDISYKSAVATVADLPSEGNVEGDARMVLDSDHLFVFINGSFVDQGVLDVGDLLQERLMQELS